MNGFKVKKATAALIALLLAAVTLTLATSTPAGARGQITTEFAVPAPAPDDGGWHCPSGSVEDGNGKCRKPVADTTVCPKEALGVPGACYIFVDKIESRTGDTCPLGSLEDNKGKCRKPVADEIVCPEGALGAPGGCYIFVDKVMAKVFKIG